MVSATTFAIDGGDSDRDRTRKEAAGQEGSRAEPPLVHMESMSSTTSPGAVEIGPHVDETPDENMAAEPARTMYASYWSSLRFWPFPRLPEYTGPYAVGCHDIEWFGGSGRTRRDEAINGTATTHPEDIEIEREAEKHPVLVRIYYPAAPTGEETQPAWLPAPSHVYGQGYGDFIRLPRFLSAPIMAATLSFTKLPAYLDAPVATQMPSAGTQAAGDGLRFPAIMFSHGLGGCRTTYSSICGELASHGFVVCAVEHRDGSAVVTSVEKGRHTMPYRRPEDSEDEYQLRRGQIHYRLGEIHCARELLERINAGDAVDNCLEDRDEEETPGVQGLRFAQQQLRGRLDLDRAVMAGHSFGAATAIEALHETDAPYRCGIALDTWMFPIAKRNDDDNVNAVTKPTPAPILAINSHRFTRWPQNYVPQRENMARWHQQQQEQCGKDANSYLLTVRHTVHHSQSDFPVLFQGIFKLFSVLGGRCDPTLALRLNTRACLEFLRRTLPPAAADAGVDALCLQADTAVMSEDASVRPVALLMHRLDGPPDAEEREFVAPTPST
ncbi:platelet-activating factor acetylhydrolase, isoform II-domain-containing protein [Thamnocephalis sphaerospora]|uniref:1-alkyl-2-acetylglycerophosphocholine esterase n=1 Tax=Thamnocephalis sphaerospora TaxID=78915 RepID=A0A4P9XSC6_9FUNG|nr:platelet-activating factor acetylhydrolase, isoform II-domain-containing protein [Thamnocephalis sphaerospora]|eukprot:RKP09017.1 platelet-activating factor acetylhydrolase, isoform II-domain-containing protein [Thamnocephalis sphaerospora]